MIIIMVLLFIGLVSGIYLCKYTEFDGFPLAVFSGLILFFSLIVLPISISSYKGEIQQYYATKETITESRKNNVSEVERAALIKVIIDTNNEIASLRYWNNTIFDIYIPDEITKLEYLK